VWAPKEAGSGVARARLSFDSWKNHKVEPATVLVPVNVSMQNRRPVRVPVPPDQIRPLWRQLQDLDNVARVRVLQALDGKPAPRVPTNPGYNVEEFEAVTARFVRFTIQATRNGLEPSLDELEIYGPDSPDNLARAKGAKATASSLLPGHAAVQIHHLNDGKYGNSSVWISRERGRGWVQIELPTAATISRVVWSRDGNQFLPSDDRVPSVYQVEVSRNGRVWQTVATGKDRADPKNDRWPSLSALLKVLRPNELNQRRELLDELDRLR